MLTREPGLAASAEYNRKLEPTVEWHGQARERRVGLPRLGVRAQGVGVQDDIVRDHERAGLELWPSELEQLLVELVGGVQEDDVEHVVDHRQRLEGVSFDELRGLLEAGLCDVVPPVGDALVVALEREHAAAEMATRRCEPDRRITPPGTDLEHFAVGLRRANREQEAPCRRLHGNTGWPRFLGLDPLEDRTGAIVEHLGDVDLDDPRLDADRVGLDREDGRQRQRPTAADIDVRPVPRADRIALLRVEVAFAERAVVVRATVLDRVELAVQVVDTNRDRAGDDDLDRPGRQLLDRADVKFGQRYASWSDDLDEASCQGGNGPPFTSTSIPIRPARPTPAGAACPSRDAGRPSVRRARAART